MSVQTKLVSGPIREPVPVAVRGVGAILDFRGVVRPHEDGVRIGGLHYEAYEPMATKQLDALANDALRRFQLQSVCVVHSTGKVPVGETSLYVAIASIHRGEGLEAMAWFIDGLKRDVPIWKSPYAAIENTVLQ